MNVSEYGNSEIITHNNGYYKIISNSNYNINMANIHIKQYYL